MIRIGSRQSSCFLLAGVVACALAAPSPASAQTRDWGDYTPSAAYVLVDAMIEDAADEVVRVGARPPILSRQMAICISAMYDAWAAYDEKALGVYTGGSLRRPASERTLEHKRKAMAYAMYRTVIDQYPHDTDHTTEVMKRWGYDVGDRSTDVATPQGLGNKVASIVLEARHHDGANQLGDEIGSDGTPYSDYTYYAPVNPVDKVIDPDRWQPLPFEDGKGGLFYPGFLCPHWYRVKSFGLASPSQFRPPPPPKVGSPELQREIEECIEVNAKLTAAEKAQVEFMRDGPRSTGQSGHWMRFAMSVSRRDKHDIDRDAKLFMAVSNTAMDAFIVSWESKRYYDSSRPYTLIRWLYREREIEGWLGPGQGVGTIKGEDWIPYSPATFITPPFPGYTSGHATVSGACARMLELFTGSPNYGDVEMRVAGALTEEQFSCAEMQARHGALPEALSCDVTLELPTFWGVAEMAAKSRLLGGYHIRADNEVGLQTGKQTADYLWPIIQSYHDGTAR